MSKHKSLCLFFAICFTAALLCFFPGESHAATTIYVGNSDAEFICDGKDDHVQINAALKKAASLNGATVYLKGPFTYNICETLYIGDNTTLTGDKSAVLKLGNGLKWVEHQPMIQQMKKTGGNKNITICGFEMDGNRSGNSHRTYGDGYFTFIFIINSSNIDVHDMYFHDNLGDALRIKLGGNVKFYNNRIERLGHDGLFCLNMTNLEAYNNRIVTSANSGLRIVDSNHVSFHDNIIEAQGNGGPGIQLESRGEDRVNNVQVYNNTLRNTYGPGIWLIRTTQNNGNNFSYASGVRIAANLFINCGTSRGIEWVGGIVLDGWDQTVIEDNLFDGCNGAAIVHRHPLKNAKGQPIRPPSTGYTTIVRDNTIKNTKPHAKAGSGIGIYNYVSTNIFKVSNNTMSNNPGGDIVGKVLQDPVSSIEKFKARPLPQYTPTTSNTGSSGSKSFFIPSPVNVFSFIGGNSTPNISLSNAFLGGLGGLGGFGGFGGFANSATKSATKSVSPPSFTTFNSGTPTAKPISFSSIGGSPLTLQTNLQNFNNKLTGGASIQPSILASFNGINLNSFSISKKDTNYKSGGG